MNSAVIPFAASEIESSITDRFKRVVHTVPDRVAVDVLEDRLTYAQLDDLSDRIAAAIGSHPGQVGNEPVALLMDQGHLAMAALFGILKSGRGAVAFPPNSSPEHVHHLWIDTLKPLVLTSRRNLDDARRAIACDQNLLVVEDLPSLPAGRGPVGGQPDPDDLAVISYTSGSTGEPKGVLWSHRLVLHTAYQNQASYLLTPQDRSAVLASFGYGAALTQCFAALLSGATLYLPNLIRYDISSLIGWLKKEEISVLAMPPFGLLRQIMDGLTDGQIFPHVRLVILGGDDLYRRDVERFWACFPPDTTLAYRLAGSETMLMREIHIHPGMEFSTEKIPVGYPVPDKDVRLLDEHGCKVPVGEMGEIVVRSAYLASGYWRQPALTEQYFRPAPDGMGGNLYWTGDLARINADGQMEHLGRKDHMVKIRGFTVHLETIDQALIKLPFVQEAVTLADPLPGGDKRLIAYLVPRGARKLSVSGIRRQLAALLPEHMMPSVFVWIESLPRTSTGKPDRKALPPPPHTRPDLKNSLVLPRNNLEESLSRIWMELLQLEQVGVEDNFFELGGNSLLSIQMILAAEKLLDVKVPPSYFSEPTIARLVGILQPEKKIVGLQTMNGEGKTLAKKQRIPSERLFKYHHALRRLLKGRMSIDAVVEGIRRTILANAYYRHQKSFGGEILRQPYPEGCRRLMEISSDPRMVHGIYRRQYDLFRRLVTELEVGVVDLETAFRASMIGNLMSLLVYGAISDDSSNTYIQRLQKSPHPYWSTLAHIIADAPLVELRKYFSVSGLDHLQGARRAGSGVIILTYHSTPNRLAIAALPRYLGGEHIPTISQRIARKQSTYWHENRAIDLPRTDQAALYAGVALRGQRMLEQGKVVQFVSDTESTQDGFLVTVANRQYYLKPGFAELALNTGALIVPQYTTIQPNAHIHTTFLPPLSFIEGSREEKITSLLSQYAEFIAFSWKVAPESLRWRRISIHFRQPGA